MGNRKLGRMDQSFRKEAYRRFWLIKGHLACHNWSDKDIIEMHDSYLKRLWNNNENYIHEEGFQEAWELLILDVSGIAVLGGHFD
jgi:hypothetical protein